MKIEKLNENQIRCTLTHADLAARHLKLSELAYGTEKAKSLFRDMMQQASFDFGFEAEDLPLMIEAIPSSGDSIVLIITKVEDPEELDTRFSKFTQSMDSEASPTEQLEKLEGGAFSFVCPGSALSEVKNICGDTEDLVTVTLGKRHILFEIGDTQLICRRLEGEFLDYKNAIPRKNPIQIVAETKALIESIDRVSVVISDKLKSPVRCLFDHDKVMLSAKTGNGEAKDVCRVSGDGDKLEIGFNNRYLMEALRYAPADKVKIELNTGVSPAIIVPVEGEENFLYMVLPVRLKSAE